MKLTNTVILASVAVVGLAACGTDQTTPNGDFNDADVEFAQGMIPHHQQALDMATIALDPGAQAGPEVTDLAARIAAAQDPEIQVMTEWLTTWGRPLEGDDPHGGHGPGGMMTDAEMEELDTTTGPAFDQLWMELMIRHHQGAIEMAESVKANGLNPDVLTLADEVITAQQAEIDEMRELLLD